MDPRGKTTRPFFFLSFLLLSVRGACLGKSSCFTFVQYSMTNPTKRSRFLLLFCWLCI